MTLPLDENLQALADVVIDVLTRRLVTEAKEQRKQVQEREIETQNE